MRVIGTTRRKHLGRIPPELRGSVDVLVEVGCIPSWKIFLGEEEDSISQRNTIEKLKNTPEEKSSHRKIIKWKYNF